MRIRLTTKLSDRRNKPMATINTESAKPNRPRRFAEARGYTARLEQLKAELNERRLTEICAMLDDAGVPEWVENNSHRGVPSNSAVQRLKWYLARRKNVAPHEIDQKLQREMKEAEANAREDVGRYNAGAQPPPG